jgi:hypothetical protein
MRAKTIVLPGEDDDAFQARREAWSMTLDPQDDVEAYLIDRAAQLSWQIDRVDRAQTARLKVARIEEAGRIDQEAEAVALAGRRLFWDPRGPNCLYPHWHVTLGSPKRISHSFEIDDPNDPARVVAQLETMVLRCAWMLDRWGELRAVLEDGLKWQPPDRFKAVRLLGRQPLDGWEDERVMSIYLACWAMNPTGPHGFDDIMTELSAGERERYSDRLEGRDIIGRRPSDPEAGKAVLLALIDEEEARLEERLTALLQREEASAAERLGFEDTIEGERLRRYQMTCNRTLLRIIETLRRRRRDSGTTASKKTKVAQVEESAPVATSLTLESLARPDVGARGPTVRGDAADRLLRARDEDSARVHDRTDPPVSALGFDNLTNEANSPALTSVKRQSAEPYGPERDEFGDQPEDSEDATNEAKVPPAFGPGPMLALSAVVLALLVLLFSARFAAAFERSTETIGPDSAPSKSGDAGGNPKWREEKPLRLSALHPTGLRPSEHDIVHRTSLLGDFHLQFDRSRCAWDRPALRGDLIATAHAIWPSRSEHPFRSDL